MMNFQGGPYIQVACFCEQVIEDKFGVLSLIRIVDTVMRQAHGVGIQPPEDMPAFDWAAQLVVMLKSGKARGRSDVKIVPELPSGLSQDPIVLTTHFDGEEKGQNLVINFTIRLEMEGLYWFHVYVGDQEMSAIPLRVKYDRVSLSSTARSGS